LALKKLNVGITVWVQVRGNENEETLDHWSEQIGYAKVAGKWGIALRTVTGNYQYPDQDSVEEWSFNEAPRQMRLSAIGRIPELFEQLSEHAASTTQKIVEKLLETQDLVSAIKKAAAEPTATSQSPIRRRPITGGQKQ
jgi:hypothetical protein